MAGRQLAVYSRGALQRRGGRGGGAEEGSKSRRKEKEKEKDRDNSRNLTTPHRVVGEKKTHFRINIEKC